MPSVLVSAVVVAEPPVWAGVGQFAVDKATTAVAEAGKYALGSFVVSSAAFYIAQLKFPKLRHIGNSPRVALICTPCFGIFFLKAELWLHGDRMEQLNAPKPPRA